jgi:hypothetical protein
MGTFVGILLVVVAAATIVGVLWVVMREKQPHEEYYIPPATPPTSDSGDAPTTGEIIAETLGTEVPPTPVSEHKPLE